MIRLEKVSKTYPGMDRAALENVDLEIIKGEFVFLVGLSGSGKSTFLRLILREERPSIGTIHVAGKDSNKLANHKVPELRRQVGTVFQDFRLLPNKTISENVAFTLHVLGYSQKEINREVPEVLELVGLEDKGDRLPSEISGGMKKRVGIARAIVMNPKYLFCDEPNSGLDPLTAVKIDLLIQEITVEYGITTIVISHDMNSVMRMGQYIMFLKDGKKMWEGNSNNMMSNTVPELQEFLSTKLI